MFKNTFQSGLLSIFYSCGSNPLAIWDSEVQNGHIKRLTDKEVNSIVLEIVSTNVATTFISCPRNNQVLGIKLPFLVIIVKNLKRYFSFEITVLDDSNMRRRFRISNFQSTTKIKPFCTSMPIGLSGGWNQIQFNLADFTKRAYGTQFVETLRVQVHANARLRRIYFSDRLYTEEELPQDYKLFLPLDRKQKKDKKDAKEEGPKAASAAALAPAPASGSALTVPPVVEAPPPESSKPETLPTPAESQLEAEPEPALPEEVPAVGAESEPVEAESQPVEAELEPGVEAALEPDVEAAQEPVEAAPEPVEAESEPVEVKPAEEPLEAETPADGPESTAGTPSEPVSEPVEVTEGEESAVETPAPED